MKLTDVKIRGAKPGPKAVKLADGGGLYLEVTPTGSKLWRLKYRLGGTERRLAIGAYPQVGLKQARERRDEAKALIAQGVDPVAAKREGKARLEAEARKEAETFERIAREWIVQNQPTWAARHTESIVRRLERHVFPFIGSRPVSDINAPELLTVARRIEAQGINETAHRALQVCGQVFRYAVATGRAERDPSGDLRGALAPVKKGHFAAITDPREVSGLLRAMDGYQGSFVVSGALRLAPLVFVRPGELRHAEWAEVDLEAAEWRIPGEKMKMGQKHVVPLSRQAVAILLELRPLTGEGRYVFPGLRTADRPISENTINAALRRLGFASDEMTGHGFRAMASTILNEQGWHRDAIERQLAHAERNAVRAAYNYAEHLPERRKMMQAWADYLDALKSGAQALNLHRRTA